jgi:hypothetical protein
MDPRPGEVPEIPSFERHRAQSSPGLGSGAQIASLPGAPSTPTYHPPGVQARASVVFIRAGTQPASLRFALTCLGLVESAHVLRCGRSSRLGSLRGGLSIAYRRALR